MAAYKFTANAVFDTFLQYLIDNANTIIVVADLGLTAGTTVTYNDLTGHILVTHALTSGDFTIADGDTSGRKLTIAQQAALSITASGTAVMVALTNGSSAVYYVTTCSSQALESGGTITIHAWDIELRDPA